MRARGQEDERSRGQEDEWQQSKEEIVKVFMTPNIYISSP
jgi:hypothetical protein